MTKGILWAVIDPPIKPSDFGFEQRYRNGCPNHITLQYAVDRQDWLHWQGVEFEARFRSECWSDRVQALPVELPPEIKAICSNFQPHITVSWADSASPAEANAMLVGYRFIDRRQIPEASAVCRIEFFERQDGGTP